jgi:hypothetical protein
MNERSRTQGLTLGSDPRVRGPVACASSQRHSERSVRMRHEPHRAPPHAGASLLGADDDPRPSRCFGAGLVRARLRERRRRARRVLARRDARLRRHAQGRADPGYRPSGHERRRRPATRPRPGVDGVLVRHVETAEQVRRSSELQAPPGRRRSSSLRAASGSRTRRRSRPCLGWTGSWSALRTCQRTSVSPASSTIQACARQYRARFRDRPRDRAEGEPMARGPHRRGARRDARLSLCRHHHARRRSEGRSRRSPSLVAAASHSGEISRISDEGVLPCASPPQDTPNGGRPALQDPRHREDRFQKRPHI